MCNWHDCEADRWWYPPTFAVYNEGCDDGNTVAGDGCDQTCQVEAGYVCAREEPCSVIECGNGHVDPGETCDDGNTDPGDGCDEQCGLEPGWACAGSECHLIACGNGTVNTGEDCDDGNATVGDGCDTTCSVEPGWECWFTGQCQELNCGDGTRTSDEVCDDGNQDDGDGCYHCDEEVGWACLRSENVCAPSACGDGHLIETSNGGDEQCDDANEESGDGCSAACRLERGWVCGAPGEPCERAICGNGRLESGERCDDGNDACGDGCRGCEVEPRECVVLPF